MKKLKEANLLEAAEKIIYLLAQNPFHTPPIIDKLGGNLEGYYSRRINIKHRIVYKVNKEKFRVKILQMWSHYE